MTNQNINPDPDHDPDPRQRQRRGSRPRFERKRARFHCADGAGGDVQDGRHHVHRRPFSPADPAIQEPRRRHLDVRARSRPSPSPTACGRSTPPRSSGAGSAGATAARCSANKLVPISQPLPDVTELPDKGFPWQQEMAVNLKCISGTDAGTEVMFKTNTVGGIQAIRTDRGGTRSPQRRPARRQGVADRAAGKGLATRTRSTARLGSRC